MIGLSYMQFSAGLLPFSRVPGGPAYTVTQAGPLFLLNLRLQARHHTTKTRQPENSFSLSGERNA
jgi:hypothetical protein